MTRRRGELSDRQWARLAPLLPPEHPKKRGHPWPPHRQVLHGILWRLRTGAPWRDVPARYGPWQTCYDRHVRWQQQGVWIQIRQALQAPQDAAGRLHWAAGRLDMEYLDAAARAGDNYSAALAQARFLYKLDALLTVAEKAGVR
jgi:transposase